MQSALGYWTLNYGLRASYWSFNREFLLSPRASVGFVPEAHSSWAFRFATGLYYQSPFYKEYRQPVEDADGNLIISLNDKIKSQRSLQFILGTDYSFRTLNRPFKLSAEAYYKAMGRLIPYEIDNLKLNYSGVNGGNGYALGLDLKLFGQFVPGSDSWISFSLMKTQETLNGVKVPRPTDQRYSVALYFTDYFPKFPKLKFSLRRIFSDGLPVTPPRSTRDKGYFRTPAYKRVDIGLSYAMAGAISRAYCDIYRKENRIYRVTVVSAKPLDAPERQRLLKLIDSHLKGGKMESTFSTDPELIGGFTADIDNERLDASVKNELKQLRLKLLKQA